MAQRMGNGFGDPYGSSLDFGVIPVYLSIPFQIDMNEKVILKELSKKVHELASKPVETEKKILWYQHNELMKESCSRPMIFCDPENGWYEIITAKDLKCHNKLARLWEFRLRKEIFRGEQLKDDRVIQDVFDIFYLYEMDDFGLTTITHEASDSNGAFNWEAPLKDYEKDLQKLHCRDIHVDFYKTFQLYNLAQEIMGEFLNVRLKGAFWWGLVRTADIINLRGLNTMMLDMYDYPDELEQLMALMRDDALYQLDYLEKNNLLTLNNDGTYVGSGGFGWNRKLPGEAFDGHVGCENLWGHFESQETVGVSPDMFEEFIFKYQVPVMKKFGLTTYGCCEPLDQRWHIIKQIPNLRRVSVSAWANVEKMAENLGSEYVFSWKPTPTDLALPKIEEGRIREYVRNTLQICKEHKCHLEIIMKDNHTIGNNPNNVIDWVKIVREEMSRCYS